MADIIKQFTYKLPDDIYHSTTEKNLVATVKYKGPAKKYYFCDASTNKYKFQVSEEQGEKMVAGDMALPTEDNVYLVVVDAEKDTLIAAMTGGVSPYSIPDIEEDVPGQDVKYVRDKYPIPDHTYERDEMMFSPSTLKWVTPIAWKGPITTWTEKLITRDNMLNNSDRLNSEDLPSSARTAIQNWQQYLRDITETVGVAWTVTVPTGGTGYAVGDILLVQDPKYKNTSVVDEVKITVTAKSGSGAITGFSVENKRALYHPEAGTHTDCFFVTNGGGSGAKVTLTKVKQVDPWKVEWKTQPLLTTHGEGTKLAKKSDAVTTNTEDAKVREDAKRTYVSTHELAVE
jgi:hypothetical protein